MTIANITNGESGASVRSKLNEAIGVVNAGGTVGAQGAPGPQGNFGPQGYLGVQGYIGPQGAPGSGGEEGGITAVSGTAPITSSGGTTPAIGITAASTSAAGSMSASDKQKLDGIASGAQVNVATNLSWTAGSTAGPTVNSSTGTGQAIPSASATASGAVTTAAQTFAGVKTFSNTISGSIDGNAATATSATTANNLKSNATSGVMQIAGPTAGTTRVATIPNANFTVARTDAAQTFTGVNTFSSTIVGTIDNSTNAANIAVSADTTNANRHLTFTSGASGNQSARVSSNKLLFNPSTGDLKPYSLTATAEVTAFSDARMKRDVQTTGDVLERLKKVRIVDYRLKDSPEKQRVGVIAQELKEVFPEFVSGSEADLYSVNYAQMVAVCIKAIQELTK